MKELSKNDCTVLVNSCDKYEDAWEPFFKIFNIQWPDCPYDIVLSTETKSYTCDFLNVRTINSNPALSWSARLKNTLSQIDSEYILFFLEDFFLIEKVRTDIFDCALNLIMSDENIGLITFDTRKLRDVFPEETDFENCFIEMKKHIKTRTNVLVGLWRREYYLKLIFDNENPWEYEKNSNIRSKYAGYKIYTQNYEASFPAFRYCINPRDGYGITSGKWLCRNRELFESFGIYGVNYDRLGEFMDTVTYDSIQNESRLNNERKRIENNIILKDASLKTQIMETIYLMRKKIKKGRIGTLLKNIVINFKYFVFYQLNL